MMPRKGLTLTVIIFLSYMLALHAGEATPAPLGSPDFQPTPEHPFGWRGDGNGRFPAAEPPLAWGRISASIKELSTQAKKPKPDDKGKPMPDGEIRDWFILGPVPIPAGKVSKDDFGPDEAKLGDDESEKSGDLEWKPITLDTSWLNFWPLYNKITKDGKGFVAYAHTWIHSAEGKPVFMNVMLSGTGKVWLNGKALGTYNANGSRIKLPLEKGWNRLLLRVATIQETNWSQGVVQWHFNAAFFGTDQDTFESKNILWSTRTLDNGPGVGSPILVSGKLFIPNEAGVLTCIDAKDGKVLWAKSSSYADAATAEERTKNAEVFTEVDALMAKVNESLKAYCEAPEKFAVDPKLKAGLGGYGKIQVLLQKMDHEKYPGQSTGEAGESAPTPVTDGQNVYVLFGSGTLACFDLNGNRKWTSVVGLRSSEHGYHASPCLIDGKIVIKGQNTNGVVVLDCKNGEVLWKSKTPSPCATPLPLIVGGEKVVEQSFAILTRVSDGKILSQAFMPPYFNIANYLSPTIEDRTVCSYVLAKKAGEVRFVFQTLPDTLSDPVVMKDTKEVEYDVKDFPCWFSYDHCASPLLYQGLAYVLSVDGVLTVLDAAKGEVVYQKLLDLSPIMYHNGPVVRAGCAASPALAGKYIYIWDDQGAAVVIEPGRTFKQVARNRIEQLYFRYGPERNECMISNPVFSGNKLYLRGEVNLYCIGEK